MNKVYGQTRFLPLRKQQNGLRGLHEAFKILKITENKTEKGSSLKARAMSDADFLRRVWIGGTHSREITLTQGPKTLFPSGKNLVWP